MVEYGSLAIWVYFAIFFIVLVGFAIAIKSGVKVESAAGTAGVWGAAWVSTKLTQPLRILATLALTPFVCASRVASKDARTTPAANRRRPSSTDPESRSVTNRTRALWLF